MVTAILLFAPDRQETATVFFGGLSPEGWTIFPRYYLPERNAHEKSRTNKECCGFPALGRGFDTRLSILFLQQTAIRVSTLGNASTPRALSTVSVWRATQGLAVRWTSMSATPTRARMMPPAWIKLEDSRVSVCQVRGVSDKDGTCSRGGDQKAELREGCQLCWGGAQSCKGLRLNGERELAVVAPARRTWHLCVGGRKQLEGWEKNRSLHQWRKLAFWAEYVWKYLLLYLVNCMCRVFSLWKQSRCNL